MPPFIGTPEGFNPETLELLDQALLAMWRDQLTKEIAERGKVPAPGGKRAASPDEIGSNTEKPLV